MNSSRTIPPQATSGGGRRQVTDVIHRCRQAQSKRTADTERSASTGASTTPTDSHGCTSRALGPQRRSTIGMATETTTGGRICDWQPMRSTPTIGRVSTPETHPGSRVYAHREVAGKRRSARPVEIGSSAGSTRSTKLAPLISLRRSNCTKGRTIDRCLTPGQAPESLDFLAKYRGLEEAS